MNEKMQLLEIIGGARARPAPIAATGLVAYIFCIYFLALYLLKKDCSLLKDEQNNELFLF